MMSNLGSQIAIIGMACRFPGAPDLDAYWSLLVSGRSGVTRFASEQLEPEARSRLGERNYVPVRGVLEGIEDFDHAFFGYSPNEARLLDPQQRLFLETAWHALEHAALDPSKFHGRIAVFAGADQSDYEQKNLHNNPILEGQANQRQIRLACDREFLATRTSYKLGLTGPALNVQAACATGLASVHLACQSLLSGESDAALAGAVALSLPQARGYSFRVDGPYSRDGVCRAFDQASSGTVPGHGVGVVVLRRLEDALEARDPICAVIRACALNNDGSGKPSFMSPGPRAQGRVIEEALALAELEAQYIKYIETTGIGSRLSDAVELEVLDRAYQPSAHDPIHLGAVKTQLGHLGPASGMASLIKTALALQHGQIPANLNYQAPGPFAALQAGRFKIATQVQSWPSEAATRYAAVHGFGVGGSNLHLILSNAPQTAESPDQAAPVLLALSAETPAALSQQGRNLAAFLARNPCKLSDVAHTLQTGRREYAVRAALHCKDREEAIAALNQLVPQCKAEPWPVASEAKHAQKLHLPLYPYQRSRCWIEPAPQAQPAPCKTRLETEANLADWFYEASWTLSANQSQSEPVPQNGSCLVFGDDSAATQGLIAELGIRYAEIWLIGAGPNYEPPKQGRASLDPNNDQHFNRLFEDLNQAGAQVSAVVHLWNLGEPEQSQDHGRSFYSLLSIARNLGEQKWAIGESAEAAITIFANGLYQVMGNEKIIPERALLLGPCRVIPLEFPNLSCRAIDMADPEPGDAQALYERMSAEVQNQDTEPVIALRGPYRWVPKYTPHRPNPESGQWPRSNTATIQTNFPQSGETYLITGGLGGIGLALAHYLCSAPKIKLALLTRTPLGASSADPRVQQVAELQAKGAQVEVYGVELSDRDAMAKTLKQIQKQQGQIAGVFHCAGLAGGGGMILKATRAKLASVLGPKVEGTQILAELLAETPPRFMLLTSSLNALTGGMGLSDYTAANAYLIAHAAQASIPTSAIVLGDAWISIGMAAAYVQEAAKIQKQKRQKRGISAEQGQNIFAALNQSAPKQLIVSSLPLPERIKRFIAQQSFQTLHQAARTKDPKKLKRLILKEWQKFLGNDQINEKSNFFDLGGDSLMAVHLTRRLRKRLGLNLSPVTLLKHPTVGDLVGKLTDLVVPLLPAKGP